MRLAGIGSELCLLLALLLVTQVCWASQAPTLLPPTFSDREQAGGALLVVGSKALDRLEESQRSRRRGKRVKALVGGLAFTALTLGLGAIAAFGPDAGVPLYGGPILVGGYAAVGLGALAAGGGAIGAESAYRAAIRNAGEYRGWYVARGVQVAPREALWFADTTRDVALRSKVLGAVLAGAAMYAPEMAEPAARSMVEALRQGRSRDDSLLTAGTALQAATGLGVDHPAVAACTDYIKATLSDEGLRRYPPGARKAANALAYFRPGEAPRLAARMANPRNRCELLLSAANGALRWGDAATSGTLLAQARTEAAATKDATARVDALTSLAASDAAGSQREGLAVEAVTAARATGRDATKLVRRIAVELAPVDLRLALSVRTADDRPIRDIGFARALTAAALQSPPSEAHIALLQDLPRQSELVIEYSRLASRLGGSLEPSLRAAGLRAATTALEAAARVRDHTVRMSVTVQSLSVIGAIDPELAERSLPGPGDVELLAQARLRLARVIAQKAAQEQDGATRRTLTATARKLLRSGVEGVPKPRAGGLDAVLAEVGPATLAVAALDPDAALTLAERAPHSFARVEALIGCGLAGATAGSSSAGAALDKAVAESLRMPDREVAEAMAARGLAALSLVQPERAGREIERLSIPWARAEAWTMAAGLASDPVSDRSLDLWRRAAEAANACRDPEHGAKMIGWALDVAALPAGAFAENVNQSGLPWLIP